MIFLDKSQFLATHSNQWVCFILYRQYTTSTSFFSYSPKLAKTGFRVMLKDFEIKKFYLQLFVSYHTKQIDSLLPCVCSVIDHRRRQNEGRTSVTHSAIASCATFLLPHFDVICDLLLNSRTATSNLFVN